MKKITAMQHIFVFLLIVSCKPPIVIRNLGMVTDFRVGWNKVEHAIHRYQKGDTLQYMFDNQLFLLDFSYPPEINSPYVCYMPYEQSGVLGVYTKKNLLPSSEAQNYRDIVSNEVYYLPLYQYQIRDSVIRFRKMTQEERMADTRESSSSFYAKGEWMRFRLFTGFVSSLLGDVDVKPEVKIIFNQRYDVIYEYLIRSDTLYNSIGYPCTNSLINIPMFHLPLDTNIYYKEGMRKYLVAKNWGFCPVYDKPEYNKLAEYRHEIDTAQLALPVHIFQEKYMQTKDIYCLDGMDVPCK